MIFIYYSKTDNIDIPGEGLVSVWRGASISDCLPPLKATDSLQR
jgi:hypothetical protein